MHAPPRHLRIYKTLRQEIFSRYQAGDRLPSERLLAGRFGVSMVTVREAVLKLCQEGLLERRQGSGTYVLDHRQSRHVALLIELELGSARLSHFYWRVIRLLPQLLDERGIACRLYAGHYIPGQPRLTPTYPEFLDAFERGDLLGVAALATILPPEWRKRLEGSGLPLVGTNSTWRHHLYFDGYTAGRRATQWLLDRGRRRIAFLGGRLCGPDLICERTLYDGYQEALQGAGVAVPSHWVRGEGATGEPGIGWERFREIWSAERRKPDALVIGDDMLFRDAAAAMLDLRLQVPDDLLIVSHANRGSDIFYPPAVARMESDPDAYAHRAAHALEALLQGEPVDQAQVIPMEWIEPAASRVRAADE